MTVPRQLKDCAPWSDSELATLRQLIGLELPMTYIAGKLHRSTDIVRWQARRVAIAEMFGRPLIRVDRGHQLRNH